MPSHAGNLPRPGIVDGKPTFQARSQTVPELVERQQLAVSRENKFLDERPQRSFRVSNGAGVEGFHPLYGITCSLFQRVLASYPVIAHAVRERWSGMQPGVFEYRMDDREKFLDVEGF